MEPKNAEALADLVFTYPELGSCVCPVRVRHRLAMMLGAESPGVYRTEDMVLWLGVGAVFTLYGAASVEALERGLPKALATLAPLARAEGAETSQIFATSAGAVAAFERNGYKVVHGMQRLEHLAPGPRPEDPRIRPKTAADVAAQVEIAQAVFPEQGWGPELWADSFQRQPIGWLAEVDGEPAGFLSVDLTANDAFIIGLAVKPTMRRRGLASALVDRALDYAVQQGRSKVSVHANDTPEAMGCYTRAGFEVRHPAWELSRSWDG